MNKHIDLVEQLQSLSIEREPFEQEKKGSAKWKRYLLGTALCVPLITGYLAYDGTAILQNMLTQQPASETAAVDAPASASQETAARPPAPVLAAEPATPTVFGSGHVIAQRRVVIQSEVGSKILDMPLDVGARFRQGDILVELDLSKASIVIQILAVRQAEDVLTRFTLRAPFDGVIVERNAQVGDIRPSVFDGPQDGMLVVLDPTALIIDVDVAETNLSHIEIGQSATARLDAFPDEAFDMIVSMIAPQASVEKGTVSVRLTFETPPTNILPNMSAKVSFDSALVIADKTERRPL